MGMIAERNKGFAAAIGTSKFKRIPGVLCSCFLLAAPWPVAAETNQLAVAPKGKVVILPIRENIMPPLVYVVRRGVKEAMEAKADALILDMRTDGGRVDATEKIIEIVGKFPGTTVTYVNDRAFSAGAFIAVGTQKIFMSPQSVIGAAAPIVMTPGGGLADKLPDTMEAKMTSAIRALVRTQAERHGHNVAVVEAMIDKTKELKLDGEVLNKEGNILTLTDRQAAKAYGEPPKALLSLGTVESLEALLSRLGYGGAQWIEIQPTGAERLGIWINAISPLLMMIGMVGLYIEFKTPGFGLPGILGLVAFALYFFGGYVAGISGAGWAVVFVVALILVASEFFVFPGTFIAGISGAVLMLVALVMGMVDMYPGPARLPTLPQLQVPLRNLSIAVLGTVIVGLLLAPFLPKTLLFRKLVSQTVSGASSVATQEAQLEARLGQIGVTLSPLYPGGKAKFDEHILDVLTQGEMVEKGRAVRVIGRTGVSVVVEEVGQA